jgi:hypothetical protein
MPRAVLAADVTRDAIDDAMARADLHLTNVVPGSSSIPAQLIYATARRPEAPVSHAFLIEDVRLGLLYVAASGPAAQDLLSAVREHLPTEEAGAERVLNLLAPTVGSPSPPSVLRNLGAAVLRSPHAPTTNSALSRALAHGDRDIRLAGLIAASYAPSRALYAPLAEIRDHDDDPQLRAQATRLLQAILEAR